MNGRACTHCGGFAALSAKASAVCHDATLETAIGFENSSLRVACRRTAMLLWRLLASEIGLVVLLGWLGAAQTLHDFAGAAIDVTVSVVDAVGNLYEAGYYFGSFQPGGGYVPSTLMRAAPWASAIGEAFLC